MAKRSEKYPGVYIVEGKKKTSYGIDYINPQTGQRIQKILKNVTSEKQAFELRAIELADAKRGAINKAYDIKAKGKSPLFTDMVDLYLKWSRDNKKSWKTDYYRANVLKRAFKRNKSLIHFKHLRQFHQLSKA